MADLHINYSKLSTFQQCRRKYWYKFVERVRVPWQANPGGIIGRGVHESLGRFEISGDEEVGRASLDAYLRMPNHASAGPDTPYFDFALSLYNKGVAACRTFDSADSWAELDLGWHWAKPGLGFDARIDRVDHLGGNRWQIIDWKTGNYESGETTDLQLDIAHAVLRAAKRLPYEAVVVSVGWNLRLDSQRVRVLEQRHAAATMKLLLKSARRIRDTANYAASPSRLCNFCDFRAQCDAAELAALGQLEWADLDDETEASEV